MRGLYNNTYLYHIIIMCKDTRKYGKKRMFGQLFGLFPRFVQNPGNCPYKFEKNRRIFLELQLHIVPTPHVLTFRFFMS